MRLRVGAPALSASGIVPVIVDRTCETRGEVMSDLDRLLDAVRRGRLSRRQFLRLVFAEGSNQPDSGRDTLAIILSEFCKHARHELPGSPSGAAAHTGVKYVSASCAARNW